MTVSTNHNQSDLHWEKISRASAFLALIIGGTGLAGWILNIDALTRVHPSLVSMKFNTSLCLIAAAASLLLWHRSKGSPTGVRFVQLGGVFIGLIGLLTCSEILFHLDLGIDEFFFKETSERAGRSFPGRMGFASTLVFMLLGTALFHLPSKARVSSICATLAAVVTLLIFLIYFYRLERLETGPLSLYLTIAVHTVVAFLALSLGILLVRPEQGIIRAFVRDSIGAKVARRMLPGAVLLPIGLGWIRTIGRNTGWFGPGVGTAGFVLLIIFCFVGLIWWTILAINREEAERQQTDERFRALVMASSDALYQMSPDWVEMRQLTGEQFLTATTEPNRSWMETYILPEDQAMVLDSIQKAIRTKSAFELEHRVRRADGTAGWIFSRAIPLLDENGNIREWFGAASDVTERKRAEEEIRRHSIELEERVRERTADLKETNEQLEAFVYSIAHDLRAPMRAMQGFSQLLIEDHAPKLEDSARNYLNRINASSVFMDKMIMDLLAFGRAGRSEIQLEAVSVDKAWQAALFQCANEIEQSRAHIPTCQPLPTVQANEATLTQVLANLLSNGLKFIAPGVEPRIRFRTEDRGENVRLWVEDNGVGIPPLHHERVFRVFERLEGARYPGTGIGLSIVRKGVERMGGQVGLESEPDQGTRFWIELRKG